MILEPISIEEMKKVALKNGFVIHDSKARGWRSKYKVSDKNGYLYHIKYQQIRKSKSPKKFTTANPYTIDNIRLWLESENHPYELIDNKYLGNEHPMRWRHKSGNFKDHIAPWKTIQKGSFSKEIAAEGMSNRFINKNKFNGKLITDEVIESMKTMPEWKIDGDILSLYTGSDSLLPMIHQDGYRSLTTASRLKEKIKPSIFQIKDKEMATINMRMLIKNKTPYIMKDNQIFSSMDEKYVFICLQHGEFVHTLSHIIHEHTFCPQCMSKMPKELFKKERDTPEYSAWRISVYQRDWYTCQCCGEKGDSIKAHHKDGYHWCEERRTDIDNGITLCDHCHTSGQFAFHKLYGNVNNTEEQFNEWMTAYQQKIRRLRFAERL